MPDDLDSVLDELRDQRREYNKDRKRKQRQRDRRAKQQTEQEDAPASPGPRGYERMRPPSEFVERLMAEVDADAENPPGPQPHPTIPNTLRYYDGTYKCTVCGKATKAGIAAHNHQAKHVEDANFGPQERLDATMRVLRATGTPADAWTMIQTYVAWLEDQLMLAQQQQTQPSDADIRCQLIEDALDALSRGEQTMSATLRSIREVITA